VSTKLLPLFFTAMLLKGDTGKQGIKLPVYSEFNVLKDIFSPLPIKGKLLPL